MTARAEHIVLLVHYFPPINSSGAKRMEAMAKYFVRAGRSVTVITTQKSAADGDFTESFPPGVVVHELDWLGRVAPSGAAAPSVPQPPGAQTSGGFGRKLKDLVMRWFGQIPDPRLPFAFSFLSPLLAPQAREALRKADVIIGSCPPWPPLLAALIAGRRFRKPAVLEYRDHFSYCHEMPGGYLAKKAEFWIDRALARRASYVVAISEPMAAYYAEFNPNACVIRNGFDPEVMGDVRKTAHWSPPNGARPVTIRYMGVITPGRIPHNLLAALSGMVQRGEVRESALRFEIYGECDVLRDAVARQYATLTRMFDFRTRVPYRKSLELALTADYLLFCETPSLAGASEQSSAAGVLTTKLFEYFASGRPVLADLDPNTLAGRTMQQAGDHHIVCDSPAGFEKLLSSPAFWNPVQTTDTPFVQTVSRAAQAEQYLQKLDHLIKAGRDGAPKLTREAAEME